MKHFNELLSVRIKVNILNNTVNAILMQQHQFSDEIH